MDTPENTPVPEGEPVVEYGPVAVPYTPGGHLHDAPVAEPPAAPIQYPETGFGSGEHGHSVVDKLTNYQNTGAQTPITPEEAAHLEQYIPGGAALQEAVHDALVSSLQPTRGSIALSVALYDNNRLRDHIEAGRSTEAYNSLREVLAQQNVKITPTQSFALLEAISTKLPRRKSA
jgi:hypothetical protein